MIHNQMNVNVNDYINTIMSNTSKRLLSEDEVDNGKKLTRNEFIKRARRFVKDDEIAIPADKQNDAIKLLAMQNRRRLPQSALKGLTAKDSNLLDPAPRGKKKQAKNKAKGAKTK